MNWIDRRAAFIALPWLTGIAYGLFYLYSIGDLTLYGPPGWGAYVVDFGLERIFSARSTLMFEAIAVIEMGWLVWLFSPLNLLFTLLLAGLLAANMHGALYIRAHPSVCRRPGRGGLLGAVPALLAGGACCAPGLILLLGIPSLGAFVALFGYLMPASIVLLALSRLWQHRQGAPPVFRLFHHQSGRRHFRDSDAMAEPDRHSHE